MVQPVEQYRYCKECKRNKRKGCGNCLFKCVQCKKWVKWDDGGSDDTYCSDCWMKNEALKPPISPRTIKHEQVEAYKCRPGEIQCDYPACILRDDHNGIMPHVTIQSINAVDHPPHYNNHPSGIECLTIVRHMNFNRGNAIKYIWRADSKGNAIEDLKKARFYLDDEIKRLEDGRSV